ncbi:hypothetical protein NTGHW29_430007 [Candidatus Nitrotoga sp. HW29]|uniref:hypothetical protein n=1 Tax=Candidatus Nitrotoga sp. HW29 TaxID=2886963 RepID=UPI001EF39A52|nr:hypothetical protein [Candidatus Nitrotoga sp. HW29]CAH1905010.1 hypothetical protein NTGHW29_430007 [Candidatus Nitrotoga sp. HW29]
MLFWFILMPFIMAVSIDRCSTRMIRTFQFSSQSPIRHRIDVLISTTVMFGVAIWTGTTDTITSVVAPLAIASIGWATWMWISNLQKQFDWERLAFTRIAAGCVSSLQISGELNAQPLQTILVPGGGILGSMLPDIDHPQSAFVNVSYRFRYRLQGNAVAVFTSLGLQCRYFCSNGY